MSVIIDASGRRSVQAEVEVPGSPEEVWHAIASGPGVSSWFVPTEVDERQGGFITASFGPGMESVSTISVWDPPRRFAAESRDDVGPNEPSVTTEWIVEPKPGGSCLVRVVHGWLMAGDEWDERMEGHTHGWRAFFRILQLYMEHFAAEPCAAFQLMASAPEPQEAPWQTLTAALGAGRAAPGTRVRSASGAPRLAARVEHVGTSEDPELLLRLDEPGPGLVHLFAMPMEGQVLLPARVFLYGERAQALAEREQPVWQAWLERLFAPPPAG
jgi:uncharacterized protein YndB with AHSA1/START domain